MERYAPEEFAPPSKLELTGKDGGPILLERHYGLLAACKGNLARAKQLIAAPLTSIDPSMEHDDPDVVTGATADHCPPCPCRGRRMIIVESFRRGGAPRAPPSP
jgi:hypothetical protein